MTAPPTAAPVLPPPPLPVRTARLVLRHVRPEDEPDMRYYMDPEVCRFLPVGPFDAAGMPARVVGDLALRLKTRRDESSPPAVAEIGWVFGTAHQGVGLATEAARALVDLAFGSYPVHRLFAQLDPRNDRSARLCERLGMRREAHLRQDFPESDGSWGDTAIYGLLREEWAVSGLPDGAAG